MTLHTIPLVSILIPMYNAENYIAHTIESCLQQTYPNIEIVIVNDGSKDTSEKIAQDYAQKYQNILVYTQTNKGVSAARNQALKLSNGQYIQYLDADDLLEKNKINVQIEILKNAGETSITFGRFSDFYEKVDSVHFRDRKIDRTYDHPKQFLVVLWESYGEILPLCWLTPRKIIDISGPWREDLVKNEDGEFFARVAFHAKKVIYTPDAISYYRKDNPNSLAKSTSKKAIESVLNSYQTYFNLMKNDIHKSHVRKSLARVYSLFLYEVYPDHPDLVKKVQKQLDILNYHEPITPIEKGIFPVLLAKLVGFYKARNIIIATRKARSVIRKLFILQKANPKR
jgi:glycosyltransferase involved in cell wall biosynthesis